MNDVDLTPISGDPIRQNIKLVTLLREIVSQADDLVNGWDKGYLTRSQLQDFANYIEAETSIIVGS